MINLLSAAVLLMALGTFTVDPPEIEWTQVYEGDYPAKFRDIHELEDGSFIAAGYIYDYGTSHCIFKFDSLGNMQWMEDVGWYTQTGYWVERLSDGSFIMCGSGKPDEDTQVSVLLARFSSEGDMLWNRAYCYQESYSKGYCVEVLPDGGFAVVGRTNGEGQYIGNAWIMRLDAVGDTLWTDVWGEYTVNYARSVLLVDNMLKVLTYGRIHPDSSRGPHLLTYDMDGNLLSENRIEELGGDECLDMCYSPADGGYTLVTHYWPKVAHTDSLGNLEWTSGVPDISQPYGWSINRTMEGGYIYGGQNTPDPDEPWTEYFGVISRYYPCGTLMWWDHIYEGNCKVIYSIRQLSEGGYIAAGQTLDNKGLLIKYAPETGIEEGSGFPGGSLLGSVYPNPSTGTFRVPVGLPEAMDVRIEVYDITGRLVALLSEGLLAAGEHSFAWDASGLASGCYLVRLSGAGVCETRRCVLLR